jgi:dephospho-CoA kinase
VSQFIVGLTGGIGSGKTTIANEFAKLGVELVDADIVARDIVKPDTDCLKAIKVKFGEQILLADGTLDRAQLRTLIFSDIDKKQWLNNLMHPAISKQMLLALKQAKSAYSILVAPLLFENNLERFTDTTLVVDVPEQIQLSRTSQRDNVSQEQVQRIIQSQISRDDRLTKASQVIDNNQPLPIVYQKISQLHVKYIALSKQKT